MTLAARSVVAAAIFALLGGVFSARTPQKTVAQQRRFIVEFSDEARSQSVAEVRLSKPGLLLLANFCH